MRSCLLIFSIPSQCVFGGNQPSAAEKGRSAPASQYNRGIYRLAGNYRICDFVGCTFLTMLAYKGIPLSLGPVLEATSYLYVTVFGVTIFP